MRDKNVAMCTEGTFKNTGFGKQQDKKTRGPDQEPVGR